MPNHTLVRKVANIVDEATGDAFEEFEFRKVDGRIGTVRVPRDKARDVNAVRDLLIRKNADLPFPNTNADEIVAKAIASSPRGRKRHARRLGWRAGRKVFVTVRETIGATAGPQILPPVLLSEAFSVPVGLRGTAESWGQEVAGRAAHSSIATFVMAAAFAAPLLHVVGFPSFGFNIFGPSKVGKTAALLAASALGGLCRDSQLPSWGSTAAARSELARLFNDQLLPMNEVGLIAGQKKSAYDAIREFIFAISEGRDRTRHSASSYATPSSNAQFRTIFASTAEHSFDHYAAVADQKRDDGEYARCVDIPATGPGRSTIMDRPPTTLPPGKQRAWARREVIALREACEQFHGRALRPFIEHLIDQGPPLEKLVRSYIDEFVERARQTNALGVRAHIVRNFGLVFAGGRLAIAAGVVPWTVTELRNAILRCFRRALNHLDQTGSAASRAVTILRRQLATVAIVERASSSTFSEVEHPGYFRVDDGRREYTVHAATFRSWFGGDDIMVRAALEFLERKRSLKPKHTSKRLSRASTDWAEQTPKWPNGKSVRSFVFSDPFMAKVI